MSKPTPTVDRPAIPAEYGVTKATEFVDWNHVEDRLAADRVYWIATVGDGGRPRVRPIDGLYLDGAIYVGGSPETRWVQEVGTNPHVSIHLDGVDDVVIVDGEAEVLRLSAMTSPAACRRLERQVSRVRDDARLLHEQRGNRHSSSEGDCLDRFHEEPDPVPLRRLTELPRPDTHDHPCKETT